MNTWGEDSERKVKGYKWKAAANPGLCVVEEGNRCWGGLRRNHAASMWRMKEQRGETEPGRTDEALQRSMRRACIIQQLWIMGQREEAVEQIRGREGKTCCIRSRGRSRRSAVRRLKRLRLGESSSSFQHDTNVGSVWSTKTRTEERKAVSPHGSLGKSGVWCEQVVMQASGWHSDRADKHGSLFTINPAPENFCLCTTRSRPATVYTHHCRPHHHVKTSQTPGTTLFSDGLRYLCFLSLRFLLAPSLTLRPKYGKYRSKYQRMGGMGGSTNCAAAVSAGVYC